MDECKPLGRGVPTTPKGLGRGVATSPKVATSPEVASPKEGLGHGVASAKEGGGGGGGGGGGEVFAPGQSGSAITNFKEQFQAVRPGFILPDSPTGLCYGQLAYIEATQYGGLVSTKALCFSPASVWSLYLTFESVIHRALAAAYRRSGGREGGGGLHSSTSQLNLSRA